MKPFLKWAGNKYRLIQDIRKLLPPGQRLIEPFTGSGAVFLNTDYSHYALADNNADLIQLYRFLQENGEAFIADCRRLFTPDGNTAASFRARRTEFNTTSDPWRRALLFVYLNRHGYNGLCRYNRQGGFNVPFGRYLSPYFPETEMRFFIDKSQQALFSVQPFEDTMRAAQPGDVVYCDPPYVPLSPTASFTSYSPAAFGRQEQQRLAQLAIELQDRGIPVLISNHDTPFTREAYYTSQIQPIQVRRSISCRGNQRGKADEILALFTRPDLSRG